MSGLKNVTASHMLRSVFGKTPGFCSSMKFAELSKPLIPSIPAAKPKKSALAKPWGGGCRQFRQPGRLFSVIHDHHHSEPVSALHRPRKGIWNRIVDYNGTILLAMEKIGWVRNLKIAPQFA